MLRHLISGRSPRGFAWLIALWLGVTATGFGAAERYAAGAGDPASAPSSWPSASSLTLSKKTATLVVALHPRCPCSRATVAELARLMARAEGRLRAYALIVIPNDLEEDSGQADVPTLVANIPGVEMIADVDGKEAARFGARTSGQVLLYDALGALRFQGGITPARGHEGDSVGQQAILNAIADPRAEPGGSAVFGCALF